MLTICELHSTEINLSDTLSLVCLLGFPARGHLRYRDIVAKRNGLPGVDFINKGPLCAPEGDTKWTVR